MDSDNIDFADLVESIQELFGKACVLFNVPLGQGPDFRGVAATLKPPADTAGALVDPGEISESLLETIIEVDEAVTERYFEGTPPTDEELAKLIPLAVAAGHADSDRLRVGQDRQGLRRNARRPGPLRRAADARQTHRRRTPPAKRSKSRPIPPGRWSRRCSRPASIRSCKN